MRRPLLIDFYCCQGGASKGYADAGFDVLGVDLDPQPHYPFSFLQMDAPQALRTLLDGGTLVFTCHDDMSTYTIAVKLEDVAAFAASPPCQAYSNAQRIQQNDHPELVEPTRELLIATGKPYVIENVEGAPLIDPVTLCGSMFGLDTYRHRLFEAPFPIAVPPHPAHVHRTTKMGRRPVDGEYMHIVGNFSGVERARSIMGMDWATRDGLREAIPPAYTAHIGAQLLALVGEGAA